MENEKPVLDYGSRTLTTGKAKTGLPDALATARADKFECTLGLTWAADSPGADR